MYFTEKHLEKQGYAIISHMDTNHLLDWLFAASLVAGGSAGLFAVACLPMGFYRVKYSHDHRLVKLARTLFGVMLFFAIICVVLWFTALNANQPL